MLDWAYVLGPAHSRYDIMEQLEGMLGQVNVDYYVELFFLYTPKLNEASSNPQPFLPIECWSTQTTYNTHNMALKYNVMSML